MKLLKFVVFATLLNSLDMAVSYAQVVKTEEIYYQTDTSVFRLHFFPSAVTWLSGESWRFRQNTG